jgi:hypothetical protein
VTDDDAAPGHIFGDDDRSLGLVEKVEIEREAHAEGVNAEAARDEETAACVLAIEMGKTEEASAEAPRHSNLLAEDGGDRQTLEPWREARGHADSRLSE